MKFICSMFHTLLVIGDVVMVAALCNDIMRIYFA